MAIADDAIIVSVKAIDTDEPYDIVESNVTFLNGVFAAGGGAENVSTDAFRSYYVDYYRGEVQNGGFSQFVFNSDWDADIVRLVREGLAAIGATRNLELFEQAAAPVERLSADELDAYLSGEYFGENSQRDDLSALDERLFEIIDREDLIELNYRWLKAHPKLVAITRDEAMAEIERRSGN